jgi:Ala-tRNA(Pro) deacylase
MPLAKLKEYLDEKGIKYVLVSHSPAFTAQEVAHSAHVAGRDLAKTVMVKLDGTMVMVVLPACARIDFAALCRGTGSASAMLAGEGEFGALFPGCEVGAMPPFGNLYGVPVYVDESLTQDKDISFNAGTHAELLRLTYEDFARLVQPRVVSL